MSPPVLTLSWGSEHHTQNKQHLVAWNVTLDINQLKTSYIKHNLLQAPTQSPLKNGLERAQQLLN